MIDEKTINDYFYENVVHTYKIGGWVDLSGIPLNNINISNAEISNVLFSGAIFDDSTLQSIKFSNCNLNGCSFNNCHITTLIFDKRGGLSNCSWINSNLNNIEISSRNFGIAPTFNKVSYFNLLCTALSGKKRINNCTNFSSCKIVDEVDGSEIKEHKSYISWYQDTIYKYTYSSASDSLFKRTIRKISNISGALTTMNWSSITSTVITGGILIFIFSFLFFIFREYFTGVSSYSHSLNLSIHIFTTLGLSDIKPNLKYGDVGLWLVSAESILGYFWLALTMMVFSRNIFK